MIVRSGQPVSFPLMFSTGAPDGNVSWQVLDMLGAVLASGTTTVPSGAVSVNLVVAASVNTLAALTYVSSRDLVWNYTTGGAIVAGELRYNVEARTPLGASTDGVRAKLGVAEADLPDAEISVMAGYLSFRESVTDAAITAALDGGRKTLALRNAIEAAAALTLVKAMPVRIAASEDSGTNSYKRQTIDWIAIEQSLVDTLTAGILIANPSYDPTSDATLFVIATPGADPVTGAAYS